MMNMLVQTCNCGNIKNLSQMENQPQDEAETLEMG
jgi:hypothetical protein